MIKAYLYLYLRVSADTDDLNLDRSTHAMCKKNIKLIWKKNESNSTRSTSTRRLRLIAAFYQNRRCYGATDEEPENDAVFICRPAK